MKTRKSQISLSPEAPVTADVEGVWPLIAQKAYELWEQRGRREGNDLDDWLDAEEIVMDALHESRE